MECVYLRYTMIGKMTEGWGYLIKICKHKIW